MGVTKIDWADRAWNPVTGCTKVSAGCKHCYAERISKRLRGRCGYPEDNPFRVTLHEDRLQEPLHWRKPSRVFVCSMGDLFHEDVPFDFIHEVWDIMKAAEKHIFLILTKRPERMKEVLSQIYKLQAVGHSMGFWNHVWLGVSVEDQTTADERIPLLLQTPAAKRFVSYEPALGPVDFKKANLLWVPVPDYYGRDMTIDWIIMGGETGPGARPMHQDWARSARDQCQAADVPFFFKQWGEWLPYDQATESQRALSCKATSCLAGDYSDDVGFWKKTGKKTAGHLLDGREWREIPI